MCNITKMEEMQIKTVRNVFTFFCNHKYFKNYNAQSKYEYGEASNIRPNCLKY